MKPIFIILTLFLVGCSGKVLIEPKNLDKAEKMCKANGGIKNILFMSYVGTKHVNYVSATCNNGVQYTYKANNTNKD